MAQWGDVVLPPPTSPMTVSPATVSPATVPQRPYVQLQQNHPSTAGNSSYDSQSAFQQQTYQQPTMATPYSFYPSSLLREQNRQQQQYQTQQYQVQQNQSQQDQFRQYPQQQYPPSGQSRPMQSLSPSQQYQSQQSPSQQYAGQAGQYTGYNNTGYRAGDTGLPAQEAARSQIGVDPNRIDPNQGGAPEYIAAPAQIPYTGPDPSLAPRNTFGSQTTGVTSIDAVVGDHPLIPVLNWAKRERGRIAEIKDYTALLVKQENVNGKIQEASAMEIKIRQNPFSVYLKFREPKGSAGQEAIYVEGQNDGKMWAHAVGIKGLAGTMSLEPTGSWAMSGNKYPITEIGLLHLVDQLIKTGSEDIRQNDGCTVKYYENAKVGNRVCSCIEVTHPAPSPKFRYYVARVYIDNKLLVPIKYESYYWPKSPDAQPELIEAYIYHDLKFNVGLTDHDFDIKNKEYKF
ncbi:MAG: DUF1571 domain-containing protein [Planctomycetaceae bacterium]|nr:DUF1571 domain-containing protein [Planctomycetaceae bacterium]